MGDRRWFRTGSRVAFNCNGEKNGKKVLFDLDDRGFLLDDMRGNVLKSDGRLIRQADYAGLEFEDGELLDYFASRDGILNHDKRYGVFDPSG